MAFDISQVGNTREVEAGEIIFKREDENPSGSVKDRGVSYQLDWAKKEGIKSLVISSSGNAAISACFFCQTLNLNLYIFVSPKINKKKLNVIQEYPFRISVSKRPLSDSIKLAKKNNFYHLRSSTDPRGSIGYQRIAEEILGDWGNPPSPRLQRTSQGNQEGINSIFIPVSSGTTLVGISEGFNRQGSLPQIHAVQTTKVNTIAKHFDQEFTPTKTSLADALVAKFTPRKKQIIGFIRESKGWGWVIDDKEILKADEWFKNRGIETSFEGGAALAGIWKAKQNGWKLGKTVCLLTGKRY